MLITCPCCNRTFLSNEKIRGKVLFLKMAFHIRKLCCTRNDITEKELLSVTREPRVVKARHLAAYLIYKYCGFNLKRTGGFVNRDHTTVVHARKRCFNSYATRSDLYEQLVSLSAEVESLIDPMQSGSDLKAVA